MSNPKASLVMVEDSPTQAARLKFQLDDQGYRVRVATRGEQALELCREELPELLITDVTMPGMDGYELCRLVKSDEKLKGIPVMLLTGLSDPQDIIWGLEAGADCYLTKPYTDEELFNRIDFVLANVSPDEQVRPEETEPIVVAFLGETRTIKSTRKQMLNLLLSTYESAARRNEHLDKTQLKMKIELKEAQRRAEMAEASLTIAQAHLEDSEEAWAELTKAMPAPLLVYEDEDLLQHSASAEDLAEKFTTLDALRESGLEFQQAELEIGGMDLVLVCPGQASGSTSVASSAPVSGRAEATEVLPAGLKKEFLGRLSTVLHAHLEDAMSHLDSDPARAKAALSRLSTLDLFDWESLTYRLDLQQVEPKQILDEVTGSLLLQSQAAARDLQIKVGTVSDGTAAIDKGRVSQALTELVQNALVHGPSGGTVEISSIKVGGRWQLSVKDAGSGPAASLNGRLGELFASTEPSRLGLGLAYAGKVAKSHGGELTFGHTDGFTALLDLGSASIEDA